VANIGQNTIISGKNIFSNFFVILKFKKYFVGGRRHTGNLPVSRRTSPTLGKIEEGVGTLVLAGTQKIF